MKDDNNKKNNDDSKFDVIILGSGMAGIPALQKCLDLGAKTAIIIGNQLGGTCLNVGCIPTKAMWQAVHMQKEIEKSKKFGYHIEEKYEEEEENNSNKKNVSNASVNRQITKKNYFRLVMEYQEKIVKGMKGLTPDKIREWGSVKVIEDLATIKSKNQVELINEGRTLETDKIFIATGSKYKVPTYIKGVEYAIDGDQALKLRELPNKKRVFIIGGGFGGLEYTTFFAPFAKNIYLSTRKSELFPKDKDVSTLLEKKIKEKDNVTIFFNDKVKRIERKDDKNDMQKDGNINFHSSEGNDDNKSTDYDGDVDGNNNIKNKDNGNKELHLEYPLIVHHETNGKTQQTEVDLVLYMTKRIPNIDQLNLDEIGVEHTKLGIKVNEYLQTTVPNIYAGGDVTNTTKKLTTVASIDGETAAQNMVKGNSKKRQDERFAVEVMYTEPPIGHVGMMEEEVKKEKKGIRYSILKTQYNKFPRGIINRNWSNDDGFLKVIYKKETGELLGGMIYGEDADNMIQIIMVAMRGGLTTFDLGNLPFFHPSLGEGVRYTSLH